MVDRLEFAGIGCRDQQEIVDRKSFLASLLVTRNTYREYAEKICWKLFFPGIAEDLLSETSIKILSTSSIPELNSSQLVLYLKTAIFNTARRLVRREISHQTKLKRFFNDVFSGSELLSYQTDQGQEYRNAKILAAIQEFFRRFPDLRLIMDLKIAEASNNEIAEGLQITENQVRYRFAKAKKLFKKVLEDLDLLP